MNKLLKRTLGRENGYGLLFAMGAVAVLAVFWFYPMAKSLQLSFYSVRGAGRAFIGFANYSRMFDDTTFWLALRNNFIFMIVQIPLMTLLALLLAVVLNNPKLKYRAFFRLCIFLPSISSLVAYSVLFKSFFAMNGVLNQLLLGLSLIDMPIDWLLDPFWAKVCIVAALTWRWTGYNMIFYLSYLQTVSPSVYEAARLDGASSSQLFWRMTVPLLKPILLLTTIMSTNGIMQLFDEVVNLTGGGPQNSTVTVSKYIYDLSFRFSPDFGYAATVSYVIVFIVAALTLLQTWLSEREDSL